MKNALFTLGIFFVTIGLIKLALALWVRKKEK